MTRLLLSTALAGLLAASGGALAQDHHDDHGHPAGAPHAAPHPPAPHPPAAPGPAMHGPAMHGPGPADHHAAPPGPPAAAAGPAMRRDDHRAGPAMAGPRGPGPAMAGPRPGPAMAGPRPGARPNYSSYHRNFNAPHHFHAPAYSRPSGWYARRWTFGEILPALFWTNNYWINDFSDYGLMSPPPGTLWVRDGNDALLIDQYSGEIIQVDYGVFY